MAEMPADPRARDSWDIMMSMDDPLETRTQGEWWAEMEEVLRSE